MTWWRRLRERWRLERELDAELLYHVDHAASDLEAQGVPRRDARIRALSELGGLETVKDACRDVRGTRGAHDLAFDLRVAWRRFIAARGFSLLAAGALAIGLGVATTLFTIVNALCLRAFPLHDVQRLVEIARLTPSGERQPATPDLVDRLATPALTPLEGTAAYVTRPETLREADAAAQRISVTYASASVWPVLAESPVAGRAIAPADDVPGAAPVVLLSDRLARALEIPPDAVPGARVRLDGLDVTVIGVMRPAFRYPDNADAWRPLAQLTPAPPALTVIGRLTRDASPAQAEAAVAARLIGAGTDPTPARPVVTRLDDRYRNPVTNPAWLAFITTAVLLVLIACSNVATLLLSRGAGRHPEIALRLALGATRGRIIRQLLIETALLCAAGGVGAVLVALAGLRLFQAALPEGAIPYWVALTIDARVAGVLAIASATAILLAGLAPARQLARADSRWSLRPGPATATSTGSARWTWVFLTAQLGLTVLLLSAVGFNTVRLLSRQDGPAIDGTRVLTFSAALPPATDGRAFYDALAGRLMASGRVRAFSLASAFAPSPRDVRRVVRGASAAEDDPLAGAIAVTPPYFKTTNTAMLAGRAATASDAGLPVTEVVVNARFAALFLEAEPLGRTIRLRPAGAGPIDTYTVVGVAADVVRSPNGDAQPAVYLPLSTNAMNTATALVLADGAAVDIAPLVRDTARQLEPDAPLERLRSLADAQWQSRWNARVSQGIITTIALIALALATVGLTALTVYSVTSRRREFAVRVALGARPGQLTRLVLRRVLLQVAVGLVTGGLAAVAWGRVFGPPGTLTAPSNLAIVSTIVVAVALAGTVWPAWHAARVDPLAALRAE